MEKKNIPDKVYLFGFGEYGKRALEFLGEKRVIGYLDNDILKDGSIFKEKEVHYFASWKNNIKGDYIIITVSPEREKIIAAQLKAEGFQNYTGFLELRFQETKERISKGMDSSGVYKKAIQWIKDNTIDNSSIICTTGLKKGYPEVTGYYIPSLMRWGYRDLAISYAKWLCKIQKENGSWFDTEDKAPYVFDSGQILKGLLAVRQLLPEVDEHIIKGCEWILSQMREDGRLVTPSTEAWGNDRETCDEVIHIYCLSPIIEAAEVYDKPEYVRKARKIWEHYRKYYYEKIVNFSLLSHFQAYLIEALLDIGEDDIAKQALKNMESYQKDSGAVPAYNHCDWVCSTGLFQLAMCWFRTGDYERGNRAFEYACRLQNDTGGWYGSYLSEENPNEENMYIPFYEISWAVKYYLDALYYKAERIRA